MRKAMALYPVQDANDWTRRVLAQYAADNSASLLADKPAKKVHRVFSRGRI